MIRMQYKIYLALESGLLQILKPLKLTNASKAYVYIFTYVRTYLGSFQCTALHSFHFFLQLGYSIIQCSDFCCWLSLIHTVLVTILLFIKCYLFIKLFTQLHSIQSENMLSCEYHHSTCNTIQFNCKHSWCKLVQ